MGAAEILSRLMSKHCADLASRPQNSSGFQPIFMNEGSKAILQVSPFNKVLSVAVFTGLKVYD